MRYNGYMKNFSYTVRDADGALKHGNIQAADRAAALAALKARGFTPVEVKEGGAPVTAGRGIDKRTTLILSGMLVLLLVVASLVIFKPTKPVPETQPVKTPPTKKEAKVVPPPPPPRVERVASVVPPAVEPTPPAARPTRRPAGAQTTNGAPRLIRGAQTRLAALKAKGLPTEPLFKHEVENILALFSDPSVDVPPHPFDHNLEEQAQIALAATIEVTDDDTPEQIAKKELVAWLKEDMRQFMANGHTAAEFFAALQKRQSEDAQLYMEARQYIYETARETGNVAETQAVLDQLNAALKEKGLPPLAAPGALRRAARGPQ